MRDSNGTAATDLVLKQRHDGARGGQDVTEADHAEPRVAAALLQSLQDEFGEPFGRSHDVGGVDRLVGRDEHESLDARLDCSFRRVPRTDDVVVYAFDDIVFHNRNVFVGGRVIDSLDRERS